MYAKTKPIKKEEEVQQNSDAKIDQDFPGFPHFPADKKSISPVTVTEKKLAGVLKNEIKKSLRRLIVVGKNCTGNRRYITWYNIFYLIMNQAVKVL